MQHNILTPSNDTSQDKGNGTYASDSRAYKRGTTQAEAKEMLALSERMPTSEFLGTLRHKMRHLLRAFSATSDPVGRSWSIRGMATFLMENRRAKVSDESAELLESMSKGFMVISEAELELSVVNHGIRRTDAQIANHTKIARSTGKISSALHQMALDHAVTESVVGFASEAVEMVSEIGNTPRHRVRKPKQPTTAFRHIRRDVT